MSNIKQLTVEEKIAQEKLADQKADQEKAAQAKEKNWTSLIALSTAIMAVLAAVTTLYIGKNSSRAIFSQALATDKWSFYQAKSMKSNLYELNKKDLELKIFAEQDKISPTVLAKYQATVADDEKTIQRYDKEKKEIETDAKQLEADKAIAQQRSANFGYALIFEQIAIMLSSISALTKKRELWYVGLVMLVIGVFFFSDGFALFW